MSDTRTSLLRIGGCILGLLFSGVLFLGIPLFIVFRENPPPESWAGFVAFYYGVTSFLIIGAPAGAWAGAKTMELLLRRKAHLKRDMILVSILLLLLIGISFVVWRIILEL